ncbi:unnamed protein product, partial [Heterotrigona itama]
MLVGNFSHSTRRSKGQGYRMDGCAPVTVVFPRKPMENAGKPSGRGRLAPVLEPSICFLT